MTSCGRFRFLSIPRTTGLTQEVYELSRKLLAALRRAGCIDAALPHNRHSRMECPFNHERKPEYYGDYLAID